MMGGLFLGVAAVCVGVGLVLPRLSGGGGPFPVIPTVTVGQAEGSDHTERDTDAPDESFPASGSETEESADPAPDPGSGEEPSVDTEPSELPTAADTLAEESPHESAEEPSADLPSESETGEPEESSDAPPTDSTAPDGTVDSESGDSAGHESDAADPDVQEPETAPPETGEPETEAPDAPPAPESWIPILSRDVSEVDRGCGYIVNAAGNLPPSLPTGRLWETPPAVLLVNTHPYEGYSDGSSLYDPASGSLAVTETPYDPDGTVALTSALTRSLRGMGITVIHLRVPVSVGESAGVICDRTESMIRYYCRLYPDIGLVLDLRRSAELTEAGEILRTAGYLDGEDCGQLRISVSGGKDTAALGWDLAAALALRQALWDTEPTLSRPVRVKSGKGLIPELTGVRVLTLEAGSAGNTYAEAERLIPPLARAVGIILEGK